MNKDRQGMLMLAAMAAACALMLLSPVLERHSPAGASTTALVETMPAHAAYQSYQPKTPQNA